MVIYSLVQTILGIFIVFTIFYIIIIGTLKLDPLSSDNLDTIESIVKPYTSNDDGINNEYKSVDYFDKNRRIVITTSTGISLKRLYIFLQSFRNFHPIYDTQRDYYYQMYILTDKPSKKKYKNIAEYFNVTLFDITDTQKILDDKYLSILNIRMKFVKINKRRFFILNEFFQNNLISNDIESIFLTDSNDVLFQGNIFTLVDETYKHNKFLERGQDELFWFFMEAPGIYMGKEKWNIRYLNYCFDNKTKQEFKDKHVSCSGTSLGTYKAMQHYLDIMHTKLVDQGQLYHDCLRKAGDQAFHNIILHSNELDTHNIKSIKVQNDKGWVLQV